MVLIHFVLVKDNCIDKLIISKNVIQSFDLLKTLNEECLTGHIYKGGKTHIIRTTHEIKEGISLDVLTTHRSSHTQLIEVVEIDYKAEAVCRSLIHQITHRIFLTGIDGVQRSDELHQLGITDVISLLAPNDVLFINRLQFNHHRYELHDCQQQTFDAVMAKSYADLVEILQADPQSKVVIHCIGGQSRSVSLVLYYLLQQNIMPDFYSAIQAVRAIRPIALPNPWFETLLKGCEESVVSVFE